MCCSRHYKDFETMENQVEPPEKAKQNALAKLDLIRKWQEFHTKAAYKYCQLFTIFSFFRKIISNTPVKINTIPAKILAVSCS